MNEPIHTMRPTTTAAATMSIPLALKRARRPPPRSQPTTRTFGGEFFNLIVNQALVSREHKHLV